MAERTLSVLPVSLDIAKPVVDADRKLKTGIKKTLRGIREIEKQVEKETSTEAEIAKDYLAAVRSESIQVFGICHQTNFTSRTGLNRSQLKKYVYNLKN